MKESTSKYIHLDEWFITTMDRKNDNHHQTEELHFPQCNRHLLKKKVIILVASLKTRCLHVGDPCKLWPTARTSLPSIKKCNRKINAWS